MSRSGEAGDVVDEHIAVPEDKPFKRTCSESREVQVVDLIENELIHARPELEDPGDTLTVDRQDAAAPTLHVWGTLDPRVQLESIPGMRCERRTVFFGHVQVTVATKAGSTRLAGPRPQVAPNRSSR